MHPDALSLGFAQTCTQTFTPSTIGSSPYPGSNVNAAIQKATAGTALCFGSGSYGEIDVYNAHPAAVVTMQPAAGASASMGYINLNGVGNLTITGFNGQSSTSKGFAIINAGQGNSSNITFSNNNMGSSNILIRDNASANANIMISGNTITGFRASGGYEPAMMVVNTGSSSCPNGITFQANHVKGTVGDGMGTGGGACGTQFIGNEIEGFVESACGATHCDGFQDNGGGRNTVLDGNYFHGNSDCFLLDDGSSGIVIKNNVCSTVSDSSYWMQFGGSQTITLDHNTIVSTIGAQYGNDHNGTPSANVTFTYNIFYSQPVLNPGQPVSGSLVQNYNLCLSNCTGPNSLNGTPQFVGGSNPSTYPGFALTSSSPGYNLGVGIKVAGGTSPLGAPDEYDSDCEIGSTDS